MYLYVYDSFLNQKKYQTQIAKIETRLNDLGVGGKICRLNILRNTAEVIEDALRKNTSTVVAVGNDKTLTQVINLAFDFDAVIGYIPMDSESKLANALGLGYDELACETIAQRLIKKIDLGKINDNYFLDNAQFSGGKPIFDFGDYQISPTADNTMASIANISSSLKEGRKFDPTDGQLEVVIESTEKSLWRKKKISLSVFPFNQVKIKSSGEPSIITLDNQQIVKTPAEATIIKQRLKIIVGQERWF